MCMWGYIDIVPLQHTPSPLSFCLFVYLQSKEHATKVGFASNKSDILPDGITELNALLNKTLYLEIDESRKPTHR